MCAFFLFLGGFGGGEVELPWNTPNPPNRAAPSQSRHSLSEGSARQRCFCRLVRVEGGGGFRGGLPWVTIGWQQKCVLRESRISNSTSGVL